MTEADPLWTGNILAEKNALFDSLRSAPEGRAWCLRHSGLADQAWEQIYGQLSRQLGHPPALSIVAVGGYGRQQMCPFSDVDVVAVPLDETDMETEKAAKTLFKAGFESVNATLGYRLDCAYRPVSDIPSLDPVVLSGLLDGRHVAGPPEPWHSFHARLWKDFPVAEFLLAKRLERIAQKTRTHLTPLVVEPQVKLGAGGLRSADSAEWIRQAVGFRPMPPSDACEFILLVRNLLHIVSGRANDHMTRPRRAELAALLKMDEGELGSLVADAMQSIEDEYDEAWERVKEARFRISQGASSLRGELRVNPGVSSGEAALAVSTACRLGLAMPPGPVVCGDESGVEALEALSSGVEVVRTLEETGVLGRLLPEFARLKCMIPRDESHTYTVYEHTLNVLRLVENVEAGSDFGEIKSHISDPPLFALAVLLHDAGKADPSGPHSETGARIVADVGARWGLDGRRIDTVKWLVREHLSMSRAIRLRDVMHPETATEFAAIVGTQERLSMLTLLTWADIQSVSAEAWSPLQESLLLELYRRTSMVLASETPPAAQTSVAQRRILRQMEKADVSPEEISAFLDSLPAHYLLSTEPSSVKLHFQMVFEARNGASLVDFRDHAETNVSEMTVVAGDSPGRLTQILGVIYAHDLSLYGLRACTTSASPPALVDVFTLSAARQTLPEGLKRKLQTDLVMVLAGEETVEALLRRSGKDPARKQQVLTAKYFPGHPGIIEIRAPRGRGMPYRTANVIFHQGWNVLAARVGQWAGSGTVAFYVEGPGLDEASVGAAFHPTRSSE